MIYEINAGKNNDTRFRIPDIFSGSFRKEWKVSLSPECWYPKELGYNQINKLVGVTEFWSANNKNSVMIGWDPCYLPEEEILQKYPHCNNKGGAITDIKYFNIYYYTNDSNGGHQSTLVTVIADWRINDLMVNQDRRDAKSPIHTVITPIQFSGEETKQSFVWPSISTAMTQFLTLDNSIVPIYPFNSSKGLFREIFLWFGGTKPAPHNMRFKVN